MINNCKLSPKFKNLGAEDAAKLVHYTTLFSVDPQQKNASSFKVENIAPRFE